MKKTFSALSLILASAFAVSVQAEESANVAVAGVYASPSYYNFGPVQAPRQQMTTIQFINMSAQPIPYFNAYCSGDLSAFTCNSSCFQIAPYGSCTVMIWFHPRSSDGMQRWTTVYGSGSGAFATAQVYGTDARKP